MIWTSIFYSVSGRPTVRVEVESHYCQTYYLKLPVFTLRKTFISIYRLINIGNKAASKNNNPTSTLFDYSTMKSI